MKNIVIAFSICLFTGRAFAQEPAIESPSVMIIPFDPNMYFSDADEQLAEYNKKSIKEVRTLFRYGININVNAKILSLYETRPLLTDTADGAREDLNSIYSGLTYFKDKSMPSEEMQEKIREEQEEKKKPFTFKKKEDDSDAHTTSKLKEYNPEREYINVKILNTKMLPYLHEKYGTELFVFINQFDLATNYEHCLDRATNTFERDIKIHFSIFDHTGKQLAGDVAIVHFGSNTNDIMKIIQENLPGLAEYLAGNLPKKAENEKPVEEGVKKEDQMQFEEGN